MPQPPLASVLAWLKMARKAKDAGKIARLSRYIWLRKRQEIRRKWRKTGGKK